MAPAPLDRPISASHPLVGGSTKSTVVLVTLAAAVAALSAVCGFLLGRTNPRNKSTHAAFDSPREQQAVGAGRRPDKVQEGRCRKDERGADESAIAQEDRNPHCTSTSTSNLPALPRPTVEQQLLHDNGRLTVEPIGVVRSVYRLCVGTPRQGLLAPHARGRIELRKGTVSPDAVEGIDGYSHLWIVFLFHLNTVPTPVDRKKRRTPAKISPPALGGSKKVGVLATRSPHRFNPIGITLARLDRVDIDVVSASGKGAVSAVLHVSGIDLVDGTPVLDVKPYVPAYDAPPRCPGSEHRNQRIVGDDDVRIPEWVGSGLEARRTVTFTETAKSQLEKIVLQEPGALEFYRDGDPETNVRKTTLCIEEVLSIDVRSKYQTCKARKGQSRAERARRLAPAFSLSPTGFAATVSDAGNGVVRSPGLPSLPPLQTNNSQGDCVCYDDEVHPTCTQQIDNLLVSFRVSAAACEDNVEDGGPTVQHMATRGSGAEDRVTVVSVRHVDSFAHNRGTTSSR